MSESGGDRAMVYAASVPAYGADVAEYPETLPAHLVGLVSQMGARGLIGAQADAIELPRLLSLSLGRFSQ